MKGSDHSKICQNKITIFFLSLFYGRNQELNRTSNPLFQKTLKKASANVVKELKKLYESLEIEESEEESSDDYFGYIEGLNAYNEYEESSEDLPIRYLTGRNGFNRQLQFTHKNIFFSKITFPPSCSVKFAHSIVKRLSELLSQVILILFCNRNS